ncbi:MAG: polysaccharide export protein EpsE [Burkholderiales bacterium]|jgi:polysaccharide export outer membrane protein|nr:polysaccharide export protein EpsE [Burkholderiales bacterium]MCZ8096378.1 polysaccharide export protein EpsE [Burkholderiales bacterium]
MTTSFAPRFPWVLAVLATGIALLAGLAGLASAPAHAQQPASAEAARDDYLLGPGDAIRIQVFQNPDLTVEARVSEAGVISFPLLGALRIGGLSPTNVEKLIAQRLRDGKYLQNPQVTVNVTTFRSQQVSVLGNVTRPGRYPLETTGMRLSEVLSLAGGVAATGADDVVLVTTRNGKPLRLEIDLVDMFASGDLTKDPQMQAGDVVYVNRAPQYYIYGQVTRPGMYGVDRGLTLAQAIAKGGGLTLRGTDRGVRVHRRYGNKQIQILEPKLDDPIRPDDLIFVRESVF